MIIILRPVLVFLDKALLSYGWSNYAGYDILSLVIVTFSYNKDDSIYGIGFCLPYLIEFGIFVRIVKK